MRDRGLSMKERAKHKSDQRKVTHERELSMRES